MAFLLTTWGCNVGNDVDIDVRERLVVVEESTKSAHRRIEHIEKQTQAIIEMSSSIRYMASQIEQVVNIVKDHDERLTNVEKAPADSVLKAAKLIATILLTALITYFVSGA